MYRAHVATSIILFLSHAAAAQDVQPETGKTATTVAEEGASTTAGDEEVSQTFETPEYILEAIGNLKASGIWGAFFAFWKIHSVHEQRGPLVMPGLRPLGSHVPHFSSSLFGRKSHSVNVFPSGLQFSLSGYFLPFARQGFRQTHAGGL